MTIQIKGSATKSKQVNGTWCRRSSDQKSPWQLMIPNLPKVRLFSSGSIDCVQLLGWGKWWGHLREIWLYSNHVNNTPYLIRVDSFSAGSMNSIPINGVKLSKFHLTAPQQHIKLPKHQVIQFRLHWKPQSSHSNNNEYLYSAPSLRSS